MLPRPSDHALAFTSADRESVVELCRSLYHLSNEVPQPQSGISASIRAAAFSLLGGKRSEGRGLERAQAEQRPPRVLLFRYDAVGDYIVTSPFVRALIAAYPNVIIDVVGSTRNAAMLRKDPFVNEVIPISPSHPPHSSWLRVVNHTRTHKPDVVAALVFTRMTKAAILTALSGNTALRVTIEHDRRKHIYGKVFDLQVPHRVAAEHYMETMCNVASALLGTAQSVPNPYVVADGSACETVARKLSAIDAGFTLPQSHGIVAAKGTECYSAEAVGRRYIVVNVSAFSPNRQWNIMHGCEVARRIADAIPDVVCLVTGGPDATTRIQIGVARMHHPRVQQWVGTLSEFVVLLAGATLVVTPDTAAVHIAATAGRKVVALFAEIIKVAEWFPYGSQYRALLSPNPDTIDAIPINFVVQHSLELLA